MVLPTVGIATIDIDTIGRLQNTSMLCYGCQLNLTEDLRNGNSGVIRDHLEVNVCGIGFI